ncbi:MAG: hypothetical protein ACLUNZ_14005 [Evtepia sp.]
MNQAPVAVIGGGAAGMMAAPLGEEERRARGPHRAQRKARAQALYHRQAGRRNLTNNTTPEGALANVPRHGRFLYSAVNRFPPDQVMAYFEALGVP